MKLVIFGANGRVGRLLVKEALRRGHEVTAAVYKDEISTLGDGVRTLSVDIHDNEQVSHAIHGQDAVVSALGSWGTASQDIVSSGMRAIIPAMTHHGVERIVSLTGADARLAGDKPTLSSHFMRFVLKTLQPKILADGEQHVHLLEASGLAWTVVRSPKMRDGDVQQYTLNERSAQAWDTVTRGTICSAMLDVLELGGYIRQAPIVHTRRRALQK